MSDLDRNHPHDPMPEGEEHAPAGVKTMALVRWILVVAMAVAAGLAWASYSGVLAQVGGAEQQLYHCPMHPSVIQDHPGECPICGMDLVPVADHGAPGEKAVAGHGGHDHGAAPAGDPDGDYACPMKCTDFRTDDPNERCPECGMKLEKVDEAPKAGVPGLVPVMISDERVQLIGMRTATVGEATLASELRTVGFVAADEEKLVRVHTRFSGWIESLPVAETGRKVKQGETLATIYGPELYAAQQEFLASRGWSGEGAAPLANDARRRLELLGIAGRDIDAIEKSGEPLRAIPIRAPAAGVVVRKNAVQGAFVQPGAELFELADLSRVWVLADVYEHELGRVKPGGVARLQLSAYPGETFEGKVGFVYPTLDPSTRTLRVRVELANRDGRLKPGMYGDVTLSLGEAKGLSVPREALVDTGEVQYVFVAKREGVFEPRRVKVGVRAGERVQVLEGLAAGETVVTTGNFLLDSESRLRAAVEGASGSAAPVPADPPEVHAEGDIQ